MIELGTLKTGIFDIINLIFYYERLDYVFLRLLFRLYLKNLLIVVERFPFYWNFASSIPLLDFEEIKQF